MRVCGRRTVCDLVGIRDVDCLGRLALLPHPEEDLGGGADMPEAMLHGGPCGAVYAVQRLVDVPACCFGLLLNLSFGDALTNHLGPYPLPRAGR